MLRLTCVSRPPAIQVVRYDTAETVQILPIPNLRQHGHTELLCAAAEVDRTWLGLIVDHEEETATVAAAEIVCADTKEKPRRMTFRSKKKPLDTAPAPRAAISGPVGFHHVAHVGSNSQPRVASAKLLSVDAAAQAPMPQSPEDYYRVGPSGQTHPKSRSSSTGSAASPVPDKTPTAAARAQKSESAVAAVDPPTSLHPSDETTWSVPRDRRSFSMVDGDDPKGSLDSVFKAIGYKAPTVTASPGADDDLRASFASPEGQFLHGDDSALLGGKDASDPKLDSPLVCFFLPRDSLECIPTRSFGFGVRVYPGVSRAASALV